MEEKRRSKFCFVLDRTIILIKTTTKVDANLYRGVGVAPFPISLRVVYVTDARRL